MKTFQDELEHFNKIAAAYNMIIGIQNPDPLNENLKAEVDEAGGGMLIIDVPLGNGYHVHFGTANECWGGDLYTPNTLQELGEYVRSIDLEIATEHSDFVRIACLIYDNICALLDGEIE